MRRNLRAALKRMGVLSWLALGRECLSKRGRLRVGDDLRALADLRRAFKGRDASFEKAGEPRASFLVYGAHNAATVIAKLPILLAAQLLGYRVWVLLPLRNPLIKAAYQACGIRDFIYLEDRLGNSFHPQTLALRSSLATANDLKQIAYKHCRVGKYCLSTLMRWNRVGHPDIADPRTDQILQSQLSAALQAADAAEAIVDAVKPELVLLNERGYSPYGELFDTVLARGGACLTWNAGHRNDMLIVKRYEPHNVDVSHFSLSGASWERLKAMPWSDAQWRRLRDEIVASYQSGEWFSECATQLNKSTWTREAVIDGLGLDPAKKIVGVFPHLFWDATFFWGEDLFDDYEHWFTEVLKVAAENRSVNWIIKIHPANVAKAIRDDFHGEFSEIVAIRQILGELPDHIKVIRPESEISTLSLFDAMDYCLTVRGTIGMEASSFGIRVLTAGTGRYDRRGFTTDYSSADDYLRDLRRLPDVPAMTSAEIELARRFSYGVFIARPTKLVSTRFRFRSDVAAQLDVKVMVDAPAIYEGSDVRGLADWIASGEEDYLAPGVVDRARVAANAMAG